MGALGDVLGVADQPRGQVDVHGAHRLVGHALAVDIVGEEVDVGEGLERMAAGLGVGVAVLVAHLGGEVLEQGGAGRRRDHEDRQQRDGEQAAEAGAVPRLGREVPAAVGHRFLRVDRVCAGLAGLGLHRLPQPWLHASAACWADLACFLAFLSFFLSFFFCLPWALPTFFWSLSTLASALLAFLSRSLQSGIGGSGGLLTDEVPLGGGPVCGRRRRLAGVALARRRGRGRVLGGQTAADARVVEVDRIVGVDPDQLLAGQEEGVVAVGGCVDECGVVGALAARDQLGVPVIPHIGVVLAVRVGVDEPLR